MVETGPGLDGVPEWVSMSEAMRIAGVSDKTLRRRLQRGEIEYVKEGNRYRIKASSVMPPPATGREMVPVAVLEALEKLRDALTAAEVARAIAETRVTFLSERAAEERERRIKLEAEAEGLRAELAALAKPEPIAAEGQIPEIDRLPAQRPRRWWPFGNPRP